MTNAGSGFGRNFSRDVEAVLATVQLGAQLGDVYVYPHEVRENLRRAGMVLDRKLMSMPEFDDPYNLPADYEPEFTQVTEDGEYQVGLNDEEDANV